MRKRIEELADGRIECRGPVVEFSVSRIEIEVPEGKDFKGEFKITSKNQVPMRGVAYSSNQRMECITKEFNGEEITIQYKFHSAGLTEGDIQKGEFFIVCSQGEYTLSFAANISGIYAETETGQIQNISDFAKLAQNHWQEAKKVFYSPGFLNLLKHCKEKERFLHIGLARGAKTDRSLEEFLLAAGQKEQISIKVNQEKFVFSGVTEQVWQDMILSKSTWGYLELRAVSDADFIVPKKRKVASEDFVGSEANFGFYVIPEKMHRGKNFGRLILKTVYQEVSISVCAIKKQEEKASDTKEREIRKLYIELMQAYVDYRLKKIVTGRWTFLTCKILDRLMELEASNVWYRLFKAQALWTNGQRQEAEWILNEFKRKCRDKKSPQWGFYLYICTLMDHEELYIDRLTEEIEQIYLEHQEQILLFWCLLFLRKDYEENNYSKLRALERRIMGGCESPLLYAEVYWLFCNSPYLIHHLGSFEIKILNWARKQGVLTKTLVEQIISVFPEKMPYKKTVFALLEECYHLMDCAKSILFEKPENTTLTNDKRVLSVICGYLIRNQKYGIQYFEWYAKGIEGKLRITGLYEAYLMSMDARCVLEVPKIIQMYFKYNSQLGSKQKAILYVNIIATKFRQKEAFLQNYPAMEKFAYEQMELGRIDDNLAVIYKEVLSRGISSQQISDALSDVLFVHRLTCQQPDARRVIIIQNQLEMQQAVPLVDKTAYFPLYSNEYAIFIEDGMGNRYGSSVDYQLEKLMHPGKYLKECMINSPEKLPYLLYYFSERKEQEIFEEEDLRYFQTVMASDAVSWNYKAWLFPKMFQLMQRLDKTKAMEQELSQVDLSLMPPEERSRILEICLTQRLYGPANQIAKEYGFGQIEAQKRVPFLNYRIQKLDYLKDQTLLCFCADTFFAGKYNDIMLKYLSDYYEGPLRLMLSIFKSARAFDIPAGKLAERILTQMLYTEEFDDCTGEVYESMEEAGNKKIRAAYLTFFSYSSILGREFLPEGFYDALRRWQAEGNRMDEICGFAMLRYYAKQPSLTEKEKRRAEELLRQCLFSGMYFDFYRGLSRDLQVKYQLYDKYFIQYRTKKHGRVWLHYSRGEETEYSTEEMSEVYEGIFVKRMILFSGETVRYKISEETDGEMETVANGRIECAAVSEDAPERTEHGSRYERLNEMLSLKMEGKTKELQEKMWEYEQLKRMTEDMFSIIK